MSSANGLLGELILSPAEEEAAGASDSGCLPPHELAQILAAALPSGERARRKAHLTRCDSCFQEYLALLRVLQPIAASAPEDAVAEPGSTLCATAHAADRFRSDEACQPDVVRSRRTTGSGTGDASARVAPVVPLPWVVGWENEGEAHVHQQAAAGGSYEPLSIDVRVGGMVGPVELKFEPIYDGLSPSLVVIHWHAGFFAPGGWRLSLYRQGDPKPVFTTHLGNDTEGTVTVTESALGFDPVATPLACGFGPA